MANIKELKNIQNFGYKKLAFWGLVGALTLFVYGLVQGIIHSVFGDSIVNDIFNWVGFGFGLLYAILGVFVIIKVIKKQDGSWWPLFLIGGILALLSPLAFFPWTGFALSFLAGIIFLVYWLVEPMKN